MASGGTEKAVFGGGCFWCVEAAFELLPGVKGAVSGYAGGKTPNPTYEAVCSGNTGHAEVVEVEFDPARTSYEKLLDLFWRMHDPTTLNRQGADTGTQYRSAIFTLTPEQQAAAEKSKNAAQASFRDPIVTQIAALDRFYPAEEYHQDYFAKNPHACYCQAVIRPKLDKLKKSGL